MSTPDGPAASKSQDPVPEPPIERFSPEEEANLVTESNTHKTEANTLFSSGKYNAAIAKYDEAAAVCPLYLDYELAVLRSNMAACHLKLDEWKEAIDCATTALGSLDRVERADKETEEEKKKAGSGTGGDNKEGDDNDDDDGVEEEIVSTGASKAGPALPKEEDAAAVAARKRKEDVQRIRAKALMRRARARSELGGWSVLEGALEDYKALSAMPNLSAPDRRTVQAQLRSIPPRAKAAQEKETAEMWGKLKDLGNGLLKPFGLSTDNFQMVKDEKTGGYSMNFQGGNNSQ